MQEDELNEGIRNIEDILQKLEKQAYETELRKEFPIPVPAELPATGQAPEAPPPKAVCPKCGEELRAETLSSNGAALCQKCSGTETPAVAPADGPGTQAILQTAAQPPAAEPGSDAVKTEAPAEARAEEPGPELPAVPAAAEPPAVSEAEKEGVKRTAASKLKIFAFLCLASAAAAAVYQFGFNTGKYHFKQASRLEQTGDAAGATAAYERLILKYPKTAEAAASWYAVGNIKSQRGEPGAVEDYRKFLSMTPVRDPKSADAKFRIAEIRFTEGNLSEAAELYDDMYIRASDHSQKAAARLKQIKAAEAHVAEGRKRLAADPVKAAAAYTVALAICPGYAAAKAGLGEALERRSQPARKARAAAVSPAEAAARARAKLARSILLANRKHLGDRAPDKAVPQRKASLKDRYAACGPVWAAEERQAVLDAGLTSAKNANDCGALKKSLAVCSGSRENTSAIKAQASEERAAKVKSAVPGWTAQKQESLDKKMLALYEENHCAELLELSGQSEVDEALDAF